MNESRAVKDKVLRSILNRKRAGFTRIDVRRDSKASTSYVFKIVTSMVEEGKLEVFKEENGVKFYRKPRRKTSKKTGVSKPEWRRLIEVRKSQLGSWAKVSAELGVCKAVVSQLLSGQYKASSEHMEAKIIEFYGSNPVECPVQGTIDRKKCIECRDKADRLGIRGPRHMRKLRSACLECEL